MTICRLSRPALVIFESDPLRIRMLDLVTWHVTTIPIIQPPEQPLELAYFALLSYPHVTKIEASTLQIVNHDRIVQLYSRQLCEMLQLERFRNLIESQTSLTTTLPSLSLRMARLPGYLLSGMISEINLISESDPSCSHY